MEKQFSSTVRYIDFPGLILSRYNCPEFKDIKKIIYDYVSLDDYWNCFRAINPKRQLSDYKEQCGICFDITTSYKITDFKCVKRTKDSDIWFYLSKVEHHEVRICKECLDRLKCVEIKFVMKNKKRKIEKE